MRVDLILRQLLTATADKTAAERRIARYRDRLDTEARTRYAAEGAAPTWKAPKLGNVRLDPKDAKPYVDDAQAFASYVLERHPDEVDATIRLTGAELADALDALTFAGIAPLSADLTVREPFAGKLLAELQIREDLEDEPDVPLELRRTLRTPLRLVDEETGEAETVPGVKVTDPSATLVVTLDPDAKRRVIADADAAVDTEEADELAAEKVTPDEAAAQARALTTDPELGDRLAGAATAGDPIPADRIPYVEDPDPVTAALRSADVDRNELDTLPLAGQPGYGVDAQDRRAELLTSIDLWEAQAARAREAQLIDPSYPAAGHVRPPAPELSAAERAIVDAFDAAPTPPELRTLADDVAAEAVEAVARELDETFRSDDLKRLARRYRQPVSGTKTAIARRLADAGVTVDVARAGLEPTR